MIEYYFRVPNAAIFTLYSYSKTLEYHLEYPTAGSATCWLVTSCHQNMRRSTVYLHQHLTFSCSSSVISHHGFQLGASSVAHHVGTLDAHMVSEIPKAPVTCFHRWRLVTLVNILIRFLYTRFLFLYLLYTPIFNLEKIYYMPPLKHNLSFVVLIVRNFYLYLTPNSFFIPFMAFSSV
jgi:hypothetical protein